MKTSLSELQDRLDRARRDRSVLAFLLKLWDDQRMDGHANRSATVAGLGLPIPDLRPTPDVYGDFVDAETRLLFTSPRLFVEYHWGKITRNKG